MAIDDPNISDVIKAYIQDALSNVWTAAQGVVQSYSEESQRASVSLIQLQPRQGEDAEEIPLLGNVPVMWPRGKNWSMTGPLAPGDSVLVWMLVHSIDNWLKDGVTGREPKRKRRFQVSSAICFPGVSPDTDLLTQDATDPNALVFRAPMTIIRETAGNEAFVALAQLVLDRLDEIATDFGNHGHQTTAVAGSVTSTPAVSGTPPIAPAVPISMGPFASVATTKLKAE